MNGSDYTLESEGAVRRERVGACNSSEFKAEIFRVVESGQLAGCALLWRLNGKRWSPRPITTTTKAPKRTAVKREAAKARACVYVAILGAVLLLALFEPSFSQSGWAAQQTGCQNWRDPRRPRSKRTNQSRTFTGRSSQRLIAPRRGQSVEETARLLYHRIEKREIHTIGYRAYQRKSIPISVPLD